MVKSLLPQIGTLAAALIAVLVLRFGLAGPFGPERARRLAGAGAALGVMVGLSLIGDFSWTGAGNVNRVGHIVLGGLLVGAGLAALRPPRFVQGAVLGAFALGCAWASVLGGLVPAAAPTLTEAGLIALLAVLWAGLVVRLSALSPHAPTSLVVVIAAAAGLAWLAAISGDGVLKLMGLCLTLAVFALALAVLILNVDLSLAAMVPLGAGLVGLGWALAERQPESVVGLPVLALVLFAERTARRVPMPAGGISAYLYLLVLAACCAVPVIIAALLVSAGASA